MRAAVLPALPKPCTATLAPSKRSPLRCIASLAVTKTPRPVASLRPKEPPKATGLPVTTPVEVRPMFME